jgi:hypothetical protein
LSLYRKYNEVELVTTTNCSQVTDNAFIPNQIVLCELTMLAALDFKLRVTNSNQIITQLLMDPSSDDAVYHLSQYLSLVCLRDYEMLHYSPALVASACVVIALYTLGTSEDEWRYGAKVFSKLFGTHEFDKVVKKVFHLYALSLAADAEEEEDGLRSTYERERKRCVALAKPVKYDIGTVTLMDHCPYDYWTCIHFEWTDVDIVCALD